MPSHVFYSIDIKGVNGPETADSVYEIIKAYKMERNVVWGSGSNGEVHDRCNVLAPEIPRFFGASSLILTHVWYLLGCLFLCPLKNDWLMMPDMTSETIAR